MPTWGKSRFINLFYKVGGLATYRIDNILLELNPVSILSVLHGLETSMHLMSDAVLVV